MDGLRSCIARIGDCNGDGVPDLAIAGRGARSIETANGSSISDLPGIVRLISGKTGELLWQHEESNVVQFGRAVAAAGDSRWRSDSGRARLRDALWISSSGHVYVLSGRDGSQLHSVARIGREFFERRPRSEREPISTGTDAPMS
jgi:hypothetical protein